MKNKIFLIVFAIFTSIAFQSCEKENTGVSPQYPELLIGHAWQIKYRYAMNEQLKWQCYPCPSVENAVIEFYINGQGQLRKGNDVVVGNIEWEFSHNKPIVDPMYQDWDVPYSDIGYLVISYYIDVPNAPDTVNKKSYCAITALTETHLVLSYYINAVL